MQWVAEIAACHVAGVDAAPTDCASVVALHARLHARSPTGPVVLKRTVALTFSGGRPVGLAELEIVATVAQLAASSIGNRRQSCCDRPGALVRPSVRPVPRHPRRWARMPAC